MYNFCLLTPIGKASRLSEAAEAIMPTPAMAEKVRPRRENLLSILHHFLFQVPFFEELLCFVFGLFVF